MLDLVLSSLYFLYANLVQNADDAGARRISFTLDMRMHGTSKLAGPELAKFQGPALTVYNDGVFSSEDFASIQRIGDSLKKTDCKYSTNFFGYAYCYNELRSLSRFPSHSVYVIIKLLLYF